MYSINEISIEHINHLSDIELSQVLHELILSEARKKKLENWDSSVPFNITTGDGGSDGKIIWTGEPEKTAWFKNRFTIFQNKATDLYPSQCYEEILEPAQKKKPRKLKSQIEKLVLSNGCYTLFTNKSLVDKNKEDRVAEFRRAIKDAEHTNWETFQIEVYDSNKIKDWVNENLSAVLLVQRFNGITRPLGFRSWDELGIDIKTRETSYQKNDIIEENIKLIRASISKEKAIRIVGHSGLGKTRFIYEALNLPEGSLNNSTVYYDVGASNNSGEIQQYILSHRHLQTGVIVVDNCDSSIHQKLSEAVKQQGNLRIITIGLDDSRSVEDLKIKLDREDQRDLVKAIVESKLGTTHSRSDIEYIATISEGYPWMAVRFCDSVLKTGISELNKYPIEEFIRKLLFGVKTEDKIEYDVIRACSVFSAFGFLDDSFSNVINKNLADTLQKQMDFVRTKVYDGIVTETRFKEICYKFLEQDIIERRGTFYIVKPTVLAIHLASDWLKNTPPERIKKIIEELKDRQLEEKFLDRFSDLDQLDKAKDIVKDLWGPGSFFGSAEVLNTSWGSLLFRYVVEVNPKETMKSLENAFYNLKKDDLLKIAAGRRNLVWALEKLCFRKETFKSAAKILYLFAVAENETWGNNSTNQFKQLFQIHLPGTEVDFNQRIEIIKWGLQKKDEDFTRIAVIALARGLVYDNFFRGGGAEKQGSGAPLKDYEPQTWGEIFEYWKKIVDLLVPIAISNSSNSEGAKNAIAQSIRFLIRNGQYELVNMAISKIIQSKGGLWPEALNNLKMSLAFEKHLPKEVSEKIVELIDKLTPTDIKSQLFVKISQPEWDSYEKDKEGHYIDKPKIAAEIFAENLIKSEIKWEEHLSDLLQGEQRQGFNFGYKLGQLTKEKDRFLIQAISTLKQIPIKNQNPDLIAGFVLGTEDKSIQNDVMKAFITDPELSQHSFYFVRLIKPDLSTIEKLFELVDSGTMSITNFSAFQYGRALDTLSSQDIISLCSKISKYGIEGRWVALSLLFMYTYGNKNRWIELREFFKKLIAEENMGVDTMRIHTMEVFHWSEVVKKILTEKDETLFAITITEQIAEMSKQNNLNYDFEHYLSGVLTILLDKYFEKIWNIIGNALMAKDYISLLHLKNMIGSRNGSSGYIGLLFKDDKRNDLIFEWCKRNSEVAPKRIAMMMPLGIKKDEKTTWHPFSRKIIDEFGYSKEVMSELSANMGSYGTVGSSIPYLTMLKELVTELINHPIEFVRMWAEYKLDSLNKEIKLETLSNEEEFLS